MKKLIAMTSLAASLLSAGVVNADMFGTDVSSWNPIGHEVTANTQFTIIKATQGVYYKNPSFDTQLANAKAHNFLVGLYHYADGTGTPEQEADYFLSVVGDNIGNVVLALDWESGQNYAWGDKEWAKRFIDHIYNKTKVYPMVYVSASSIGEVANVSDKSALWLAGYPTNSPGFDVPNFIYSTGPWSTPTIWQYTSGGGLDMNYAYVDATGWNAIAKGDRSSDNVNWTEPTASVDTNSLEGLASAVIAGNYGDGVEREQQLGDLYDAVQIIVNERLGLIDADTAHYLLADQIITYGNLGTGQDRESLLGSYADSVQGIINSVL